MEDETLMKLNKTLLLKHSKCVFLFLFGLSLLHSLYLSLSLSVSSISPDPLAIGIISCSKYWEHEAHIKTFANVTTQTIALLAMLLSIWKSHCCNRLSSLGGRNTTQTLRCEYISSVEITNSRSYRKGIKI